MKKNIQIKLVATPDKISDETLSLIRNLELSTFGSRYNCEKIGIYWWIAYHKNIPVGFAGLKIFHDKNQAFLYRSGVIKTFRGNGLQQRFIRVREKLAKKLGYREVVTYTSYLNIVSANNLLRCCYRLYKPDRKWGVGYALYFRKILTK